MIRTDQSEKEYQETKKAIERLNADIAAQVRNLREADDALKRFIQDDIKELTDELESEWITNSSSVTPSTPLKVHSFALTPGQAYLNRGLPFVQRLDSGSTRSRFPQIGQYIKPDNKALVFL